MNEKQIDLNKSIALRYLEECFAKSDLGLIDELFAPEVSGRNFPFFPKGVRGREQVRREIRNLHSAIPKLWIKILDVVAEDDTVVVRRTIGGKQEGPWMGKIPPTGKQVEWTGISIYTIVNGKIADIVEVDDGLALLYQIDALAMWKPE